VLIPGGEDIIVETHDKEYEGDREDREASEAPRMFAVERTQGILNAPLAYFVFSFLMMNSDLCFQSILRNCPSGGSDTEGSEERRQPRSTRPSLETEDETDPDPEGVDDDDTGEVVKETTEESFSSILVDAEFLNRS